MDDIKVGERRTFRSTLQNEDAKGVLPRLYTDQQVKVIADLGPQEQADDDPTLEPEHMFQVRAQDGVEFAAWDFELTPHGSNVYVLPNGEYVTDPEFKFATDTTTKED